MSNPKESIARYKVGTIYLKKKVEDGKVTLIGYFSEGDGQIHNIVAEADINRLDAEIFGKYRSWNKKVETPLEIQRMKKAARYRKGNEQVWEEKVTIDYGSVEGEGILVEDKTVVSAAYWNKLNQNKSSGINHENE